MAPACAHIIMCLLEFDAVVVILNRTARTAQPPVCVEMDCLHVTTATGAGPMKTVTNNVVFVVPKSDAT
jgi:hypothetical protein